LLDHYSAIPPAMRGLFALKYSPWNARGNPGDFIHCAQSGAVIAAGAVGGRRLPRRTWLFRRGRRVPKSTAPMHQTLDLAAAIEALKAA
jgi:hypothetical protein